MAPLWGVPAIPRPLGVVVYFSIEKEIFSLTANSIPGNLRLADA